MRVCREPRLRSFWYSVAFTEDAAEAPMARRLLGERRS
jgi:hypothetical protein